MFISWILPVMGISLALTLLFELSFALLWGVRGQYDLILCVLVNILTNPIVVFVHYWVMYRTDLSTGYVTLLLECAAILSEGLLYKRFAHNIEKPFLFALSVNTFSYAAGELLNGLR